MQVAMIENEAFYGRSLQSVAIPDSVTSIGKGAFDLSCILDCNEGSYAWTYAAERKQPHPAG